MADLLQTLSLVDELKAKVAALEETIGELSDSLEGVTEEFLKSKKEWEEKESNFQYDINQKDKKIDELEGDVDYLQKERDRLEDEVEDAIEEINRLKGLTGDEE